MKTWMPLMAVVALAGTLFGAVVVHGDDEEGLSEQDRLLIKAQQICVVTGRPLSEVDEPIKTVVGEYTLFVCCSECVGKEIPRDTWAQVLANWRTAQGECPVMRKPLPANAAHFVVEGRRVYVCCRPCIARIQADPDRYLGIVDEMFAEHLEE